MKRLHEWRGAVRRRKYRKKREVFLKNRYKLIESTLAGLQTNMLTYDTLLNLPCEESLTNHQRALVQYARQGTWKAIEQIGALLISLQDQE